MQNNIGIIKQSNLCISEDSLIDIILDNEEHRVDIKTLNKLFIENKNILVKSFNIENNIIEYKQLLASAMTNREADVLEIIDEDTNKKIICTPEHQIYTINRGYIMAKDLCETDILKILQ
jgi:DNA repair protein RadC